MTSVDVDASRGLTASQVAERVASGQVNAVKDRNARSLGDIARAKGMTQVTRVACPSRGSPYRALSGTHNPDFDTILRVADALGLQVHAGPA